MKQLSIGRDASNNIILNDVIISRKHAELIVFTDGRVMIRDLGSSNGTFVNGHRITESYLKSEDIVKCANIPFDWKLYAPLSRPNSTVSFQESANTGNNLFISSSIADDLPAMVRNELATLSAQKQQEFVEEYRRKKKSVGIAYLLWLPICLCIHYGYLRKWGLQFAFWFTAGGFGIWWFIDLFRLPELVRDYNKDVASDVMRNLMIISRQ